MRIPWKYLICVFCPFLDVIINCFMIKFFALFTAHCLVYIDCCLINRRNKYLTLFLLKELYDYLVFKSTYSTFTLQMVEWVMCKNQQFVILVIL